MAYKYFEIENDNHVRILQINRPDALNALNSELLLELSDIINECKMYINIKSRLVERIHCKKVQTRYIPEIPIKYLPIHNYL